MKNRTNCQREGITPGFPLLVGACCLLWAILRGIARPTLEVDEAKELYYSQWWSLGYGIQPPLYTWLQKGLIELFGYHLWPVGLLKAFCYFWIFYFCWRIAKRSFSKQKADIAAFSLLLCFPLMIYGFRATHTLLLTAVGVATVLFWLQVLETGRWQDYCYLGCCMALGLLSKYNYGLILASLGVVSLLSAEGRKRLFRPELGITVFLLLRMRGGSCSIGKNSFRE